MFSIILFIGSKICFVYVINTYIAPTSRVSPNQWFMQAQEINEIPRFSRIVIIPGSSPSSNVGFVLDLLKSSVNFSHSFCFSYCLPKIFINLSPYIDSAKNTFNFVLKFLEYVYNLLIAFVITSASITVIGKIIKYIKLNFTLIYIIIAIKTIISKISFIAVVATSWKSVVISSISFVTLTNSVPAGVLSWKGTFAFSIYLYNLFLNEYITSSPTIVVAVVTTKSKMLPNKTIPI